MCGIAGVWGTCDENVIRTMMHRLHHRGPDAEGCFRNPGTPAILGHRRLAIIDPSGGDQPIKSKIGIRAIVANGEIYNSPSLRSQIKDTYRFQTQSDSEAALALYA